MIAFLCKKRGMMVKFDPINEGMFTREEIYDKVWRFPTSKLKESFGMSDVAIAKLCKKLQIPKPPRGYWARLQYGQKLPRIPLPPFNGQNPIQKIVVKSFSRAPSKVDVTKLKIIHKIPLTAFIIPQSSRFTHPLVIKTFKVLQKTQVSKWGDGKYGRIWINEPGCLNVKVGKDSIERAMSIMEILLNMLESNGYSVLVKNNQTSGGGQHLVTLVMINGDPVPFYIEQLGTMKEKSLTVEEKSKWFYDRWNYSLARKLRLVIDDYCGEEMRRRWSIRDDHSISETLASFVDGLVNAAHVIKESRLKNEERTRQWKELEQKRIESEERVRDLKNHAFAWDEVQKFKSFIETLEKTSIQRLGVINPTSRLGTWLDWAKRFVDSIDPIQKFINKYSSP